MTTNETATETAGSTTEGTQATFETQEPATQALPTEPSVVTPDETAEPEQGSAEEQPGEAAEDGKNPNREAAKYRRQLRDAESKLETQQADVRELQAEVIRLNLTGTLTNTADFDQFIGIEKVLGDDGKIDKSKLDAEVAAMLSERPYLKPQGPRIATRPTPARGKVSGPEQVPEKLSAAQKYFGASAANWHQVLDGRSASASEVGEAVRAGSNKVKFGIRTAED